MGGGVYTEDYRDDSMLIQTKPACCGLLTLCTISALLLTFAFPTNAQDPRLELPASALPDTGLKRLPDVTQPKPPPEVAVPKAAPSHAPAGAEKIQFILTGLDIEGVTIYSQTELEQLNADFLGRAS